MKKNPLLGPNSTAEECAAAAEDAIAKSDLSGWDATPEQKQHLEDYARQLFGLERRPVIPDDCLGDPNCRKDLVPMQLEGEGDLVRWRCPECGLVKI
jgi:hypothetical protein